jgi:hypothetical protein
MYYLRWLQPVYEMYPPGIRFLFRFDEVVIEKLNNITESETQAYRKSFDNLLAFIRPLIPPNMQLETFFERSRYENYEAFEKELAVEIEALRAERAKNPSPLSSRTVAMIELNVRLKPGQADDPEWREKVDLAHIAYYALQNNKVHPVKHYEHEGIIAFPTVFEASNLIAVGTTKTSITKFWVGVGALKQKDGSYIETILSPSQLEKTKFSWEPVSIEGLEGKNFKQIRVINI